MNSVLDSFCLVALVVVASVAVVSPVAVRFQTPWLSSVALARKVMREPFAFGAETRSRQGRSSGAKDLSCRDSCSGKIASLFLKRTTGKKLPTACILFRTICLKREAI